MTPVSPAQTDSPNRAPIAMPEFVALIAALMAMGALGIDAMLPALPAMGASLNIADASDQPLVVTFFVFGFGLGQIVFGPLADRYGRRPVLIAAMSAYVVTSMLAAIAPSFAFLLGVRLAGGIMVACGRIVSVALVRDCFAGRSMARVSSLAFMVFMVVPIIAPGFGQVVLLFGDWRLIFWVVAAMAALITVWFGLRMPETLAVERQVPLSVSTIAAGWRTTLTDRFSLGYALGTAALQGALFGYLNSVQVIMDRVFHKPELLGIAFAASAGLMAVANLLNSRIVMRLGMRRISHSAVLMLIVAAGLGLLLAWAGVESLWLFVALQALAMASFGLAASNFSAMAMERMGAIAGTASSVQGLISTTIGALVGAGIGKAFDGTTVPLHAGFLIAGIVALGIAAIVERGRLFRPS